MLDGIRDSLGRLIAAYERVKFENDGLKTEIMRIREQNDSYRKQIAELERKIDNLRLTDAFLEGSPGRSEAKEKVAKMIKEIEKCILLIEGSR